MLNTGDPSEKTASDYILTPVENWGELWDKYVRIRLYWLLRQGGFSRLSFIHLEGVHINFGQGIDYQGLLELMCGHCGILILRRCFTDVPKYFGWEFCFAQTQWRRDNGFGPRTIRHCELQDLRDVQFPDGLPEAQLREWELCFVAGNQVNMLALRQ